MLDVNLFQEAFFATYPDARGTKRSTTTVPVPGHKVKKCIFAFSNVFMIRDFYFHNFYFFSKGFILRVELLTSKPTSSMS